MIAAVCEFITHNINEHLKRALNNAQQNAVASNLLNGDGTQISNIENKVILTLVNIKKEPQVQMGKHSHADGIASITPTPNIVTLGILLSANFSSQQYLEGLSLLGHVDTYLNDCTVMVPENMPKMPASVAKLTIEMVALNLEETSSMWQMFGVHHRPSLYYRVRCMVNSSNIRASIPSISSLTNTSAGD